MVWRHWTLEYVLYTFLFIYYLTWPSQTKPHWTSSILDTSSCGSCRWCMHEPNVGLQHFLGLVWDLSSLIQTFATFPNFSWCNLTTTNLIKHLQPIQSFPNLSPHIFASPQIYQPLPTFPNFLITSHNINQPWYPRLIQLTQHPTSPNQPFPTFL